MPFLTEKQFIIALQPVRQRISQMLKDQTQAARVAHLTKIEESLLEHKRLHSEVFTWCGFQFYQKHVSRKTHHVPPKGSMDYFSPSEFPRDLLKCAYASNVESNIFTERNSSYLLNTTHIRENICAHVDVLDQHRGSKASTMAIILRKARVNLKDEKLLMRLAYKAWVASEDREVDQIFLISINPDFVGPFSLEKLDSFFVSQNVTSQIRERMETMNAEKIHSLSTSEPVAPVPQDITPITSSQSVLNLPRISGKQMESLMHANITHVNSPLVQTDFAWSAEQKKHIDLRLAGEPFIDRVNLAQFLLNFRFPRHYIDFETASIDISPWQCKPFEAMPFQFSMHVQDDAKSTVRHHSYLHLDSRNDPISDPRLQLVKFLVDSCGSSGHTGGVIAHHASFERRILQALEAHMLAIGEKSLSDSLRSIRERIIDLEDVFKQFYIDPRFLGSTSLKKIQPIVVPMRSYGDLQGCVSDGQKASEIYALWVSQPLPAFRVRRLRNALLEYCRLDTQVMVDIVEFLENVVRTK